MKEKVYHIYAKNQCIYHSLSKDKFEETWDMLHKMIEVVGTDITVSDLSYEELEAHTKLLECASY